jgi:hypothetical protein
MLGRNRQHIALLRLIAPGFERAQAGLAAWNGVQVEEAAAPAVLNQFRERVRQPTRAHVMNERNRIFHHRAASSGR